MNIRLYHYFAILFTVIPFLFAIEIAAETALPRFFVMGGGQLHLKNLRNGHEAAVSLLNRDGTINQSALVQVDEVFGYPSQDREDHISPRLLFMLSSFVDQLAPGRTVNIESAYRSPDYNDKIRKAGNNAARTSTHIDGMALDFWLEGVDGKLLWETIKARNCGGIGHYGGRTVHFDAGRPRFWQAATSGTRSSEPDENRHIYLSTLYDRYRPGESVRLQLSQVSTYGFGVRPEVLLVKDGAAQEAVSRLAVKGPPGGDCLIIDNQRIGRALYVSLPQGLAPGRYRLNFDFCRRPFARMPQSLASNEIELVP